VFGDTYDRLNIVTSGALRWGSGAADVDTRLRRSGTKTLTIDDTAAGAATLNVVGAIQNGGTQVVGARATGWGAPTGTATRTTFATDTVTLIELARRLKALIDDLTTHGLIGT
jgi:orotate phosphoribosyltransferase